MHHRILIKVKGDSEQEAKDLVHDKLLETIICKACETSKNGVNWDYVGDIILISEESLKKLRDKDQENLNGNTSNLWWKWNTPEEMEKDMKEGLFNDILYHKNMLEENLLNSIEELSMSLEEAPLYISDKKKKERACKILKKEVTPLVIKYPTTVKELTALMAEILTKSLIEDNLSMMLYYYIKEIQKMGAVITFPKEEFEVLHCTHCHFYDMSDEHGENTYYFWADRHY